MSTNNWSVVVTSTPKEKMKDATVDAFRNLAARKRDVSCIVNTNYRGVDQMRHEVLQTTNYDWVLLLDAHMVPEVGYDILIDKALESAKDSDLFCFQCERIEESKFYLDPKNEREYGAHFGYRSDHKWLGLSPIWNKKVQISDIPCLLGGAYLVNSRHYNSNLKGCWKHLHQYAKSEELISAINLRLGNSNRCLMDICIGHCFNHTPAYTQDIRKMIGNVYLTHAVIVDSQEEYNELNKKATITTNTWKKDMIGEFQWKMSFGEMMHFNQRYI
jgi:hypothetical protein